MKRLFAIFGGAWLVATSVVFAAPNDEANSRTLIGVGNWRVAGVAKSQHSELVVSVIPHVSQRQRDLVESGFSTFSQLELRMLDRTGKISDKLVTKINCTAKFDLWQDSFEIVRLDDNPKAITAKTYDEYANECFQASLSDPSFLQKVGNEGGRLVASLFVDQISADKDEKIREWLIRQQSGVMQGLFSHMLGDLKLSQRIDVVIDIPRQLAVVKKKSA